MPNSRSQLLATSDRLALPARSQLFVRPTGGVLFENLADPQIRSTRSSSVNRLWRNAWVALGSHKNRSRSTAQDDSPRRRELCLDQCRPHTAMQVLVDLDGRGVITIFPECTPLTFALVVLLRSAPRDELHALRNNIRTRVFDQKVNVVGRVKAGGVRSLQAVEKLTLSKNLIRVFFIVW